MQMQQQESGFQKWKNATRNPNATLEEYKEALKSVRHVGPPQMVPLPGGVYISRSSTTSKEIGAIVKEFVQNSETHRS